MPKHRRNRSRRAIVPLTLVLPIAGTMVPGVAHAGFPGTNGRIAFESGRTDEFDIYSVNPDGTRRRLPRLAGDVVPYPA